MPAPTYLPEVDSNGSNQPTDPAGIPQAIKDDGFQEKQNVPNTWWNWLFKTINDWIQWGTSLFGVEHNTTTGEHTDVNALTVTSAGDVETTGGDLVASAGKVSASGNVEAGAHVEAGSNVTAEGVIATRRGVAAGTYAICGGVLGNYDEVTGLGNNTMLEAEGPQHDFAADELRNDTVVRFRVLAELTWAVGSVALYVRFGDPGVGIGGRRLVAIHNVVAPANGDAFLIEGEFRVKQEGATLQMVGHSRLTSDQGAGDLVELVFRSNAAIGGEDGTAALRLSPSVDFGTADAGNALTIHYFTVEVID